MADYQVISDGSCDLGKARTDRLDIGIILTMYPLTEKSFIRK